jgi:hypothetical protein
MSSPVPSGDLPAPEASVDWDDLSGLDRILAIYQLGPNTVVVETKENRQIRITAWFDRRGGRYVADFERRTEVMSGGNKVRVWAHTPAYPPCESPDLVGCLEAAVVEVDRMPVY